MMMTKSKITKHKNITNDPKTTKNSDVPYIIISKNKHFKLKCKINGKGLGGKNN